MPEYGYLHMGRVTGYDLDSGGFMLDSVSLARTSKWGPVPSCVPGLRKGDRVVLGATGTSRDNLIIIAKVGAEFAEIADIDGLLDALHSKADVVAIDQLANWSTALEGRIDVLEGGTDGLDVRMDAAEATLVDHETRIDTLEDATVSAGSWYVNEEYQCPGTTLDNADRMPFAGNLWTSGSDVTLGPDKKHLIVGKTGIWRPSFQPRYTVPIRIPSGLAGEGTDRTFHIGVTALDVGPLNATFESGATNWSTVTCTLIDSPTQKHSGTRSGRITPTGAAAQAGIVGSSVNVLPGQKWTVTTWVWCTNAVTTNYSSSINWYGAGGAYISTSSTLVSVAAATWTPVIATFTAPVGAVTAAPVAQLLGTPAAGQIFYVDDVSICPCMISADMFLFEESWREVTTGNQHNQTWKMGSEMLLGAGDKVMLFCFWGGASSDRLIFPAGTNRMALTYIGPKAP